MNPKTKILIAIDWYRPAHKAGGPITSIENLVDLLGDEPHLEFYVVCGVFDYGEQQPLDVPQETIKRCNPISYIRKDSGVRNFPFCHCLLRSDIKKLKLWCRRGGC